MMVYFINASYRWSRDRPRPHRIDGRHGMATMAWHAWLRIDERGAARPIWFRAAASVTIAEARGQQEPKIEVARRHPATGQDFCPSTELIYSSLKLIFTDLEPGVFF